MPEALTGMAVGKYRPNIYDVNLLKGHDVNSAINSKLLRAPLRDRSDDDSIPAPVSPIVFSPSAVQKRRVLILFIFHI